MIKLNFDVKRHKLDNGLEVLTIKKDTKISSVNIGIKVGSLYEDMKEKGIAHFIEHMLFKGTKTRNYEVLNDELEFLGGEDNAARLPWPRPTLRSSATEPGIQKD